MRVGWFPGASRAFQGTLGVSRGFQGPPGASRPSRGLQASTLLTNIVFNEKCALPRTAKASNLGRGSNFMFLKGSERPEAGCLGELGLWHSGVHIGSPNFWKFISRFHTL